MFGFPGYNSLAIIHMMTGSYSLTVNGSNPNKFQKLKPLLHKHLPRDTDVRITGWDPNKFGVAEAGIYDKILMQVPSSDERCTFRNETLMKKWTSKVNQGMDYTDVIH